jgi:hypothetical protein
MPNSCWNIITIKATEEQIRRIIETEFRSIPQWAVQIQEIGCQALLFRLWSRNNPAIDFMNNLWDSYPQIWIKNSWSEEGGFAGVIVGKKNNIQDLMWEEATIEEWNHWLEPMNNPPAPVFAPPPAPGSETSPGSSFAVIP